MLNFIFNLLVEMPRLIDDNVRVTGFGFNYHEFHLEGTTRTLLLLF